MRGPCLASRRPLDAAWTSPPPGSARRLLLPRGRGGTSSGPQVGLPGADAMTGGGAAIGVGADPFGERPPLGVPGGLVAVGDPARCAGYLADVGTAVRGVASRDAGRAPTNRPDP